MSAALFRPVAIVGVGCVFPKANSPEAFWTQLSTGATALGELNEREFRPEWYYDPSRTAPDRTSCRYGALVDEPRLDARKYRIPPRVLQDMHRMQLAFIDATAQALEDARGGMGQVAPERMGLVLGSLGGGLRPGTRVQSRLLDMLRSLSASATLASLHPGLTSELAAALTQQLEAELAGTSETEATASFSSIWGGRAAKLFDLRGPHFSVDAGYASTLAAIQSASQQLNSGDCDGVVAAGCSQLLTPHDLVAFSKLGGLGTSVLAPFDRRSSGTLLGEGVGVFVLRRLEDALAAGAKVYAVIRGIGAASGGRGTSLVAPNPKGQILAMRRAYAQAEYGPRDVQYVECHASGIPLEDAAEFQSLREVWSEGEGASPVMLGGVKELTGHLQAASGAAGLLKTTLALFHKVLPPQHSFQEGAEGVDLRGTPFYFTREGRPWPAVANGLRRASVSAFGFGGLSYHLTLEEFSADAHARLARSLPPPRPAEPIAIVGLGGVFPGAENAEQLWSNLLAKHCAIGAIPPERAETARYLDPARKSKVRPYTNLAGSIVDGSWPQERVRLPPEAVAQIDRGQSWTMKAALQALDDAGWRPGGVDSQQVGVAMGYMPPLEREFLTQARVYYAEFDGRLAEQLRRRGVDDATAARIREEVEQDYKRELPPITEQTLPGYLGSLAVGRVAHHLDLQGPAMMVESACASSLAAMEIAANFLHTRECDLVLAGGMYASLGVDALVQWCSFGGLSQNGSFPFDARADGYVTSEGAAMLALKRLSDAQAAGDRIYAVIRAVAGATDPKSASIWAPSSEGQVQAVRRAVEKAGVTPDDIQYLEGHGTGTPVGDPIEVETYRSVYGQGRPGRRVLLGSIKSNLGHLNSGAGAVSLLKVALSLHHGQVPPNAGFATPNPSIPWSALPFRVPAEAEPWVASENSVRRAGVTSLGLGGTSFHAIVEEPPPRASPRTVPAPVGAQLNPPIVQRAREMTPEPQAATRTSMPIAIIGASCQVAGADTPEQFWQYIVEGKPRFTQVPASRFRWESFYSQDPSETEKGEVWRASFFNDLELPWREYKVGPKMLDELHRCELYTVEAIRRALADARLLDRAFPRERTAVIMGGTEMGYDSRITHPFLWHLPQLMESIRAAMDGSGLPEDARRRILEDAERNFREVSHREFTRGTVSGMSLALGRACSLFDLKGPHYVVNAACSSVMAALENAVNGLTLRDYDVALVGGTSPYLTPAPFVTFERMRLLTREAQPRPFDAGASGTLLGEGTGFFVLRRLDDAIKNGDTILGVIRGISGANDGRRGALLSPPVEAQTLAARRAYELAGYAPDSVQYLECHANGVEFLEASELEAMGQVFGSRAPRSLTIGSTKNMVGYLLSASTMPGLVRTLMALKHQALPAQGHVRQLRDELRVEGTPFQVLSELRPWNAPAGGVPRRAGVNSLAMGGQAYHLTLEEYLPEYHARLAASLGPPPKREPVAVVSYGALAPGAHNSDTFFENVLAKKDQIIRVPKDRFDIDRYYGPEGVTGKIYCPLGGFLEDFTFDEKAFLIPPMLAAQLDRSHTFALTAAAEALRKTTAPQKVPQRTAVFLADMPGRLREREVELRISYTEMDALFRRVLQDNGVPTATTERIARQAEGHFKADMAPMTPYTHAGYAGSTEATIIAHVYGFKGATSIFESTCASSLAAIEAAVASLQLDLTDVVLAGGTFADLEPDLYAINCTFRGMSGTGSRPFDADASGFIPGEGAGVVVLKRLKDAERDGDTILGVIKGIGSSSDGKGKSLLAPNQVGQELAVRRALERAEISPASIQYIECHGTATPVGDFTEISTYSQVMQGRPPRSVGIGSVKSMIGHLHSAAGVINLVKVLKSLERKVLPPQIHFERPNPDITWDTVPFEVITEQRPWAAPADGGPRRAGVSAFGMGGTNYHLVVEEYLGRQEAEALSPSAFPMVGTVVERTADSLTAVRELSLETDPYLREHRVNGVGVLPGTFGMEMMAEAALLLRPGLHVEGLEDVRYHQAAKVWEGKRSRLIATARAGQADAAGRVSVALQVDLELKPRVDLPTVRRKLYTGTVVLSARRAVPPGDAVTVDARTAALCTTEGRQDFRPLYNHGEETYLGSCMQGCRYLRFLSDTQQAAWVVEEGLNGLFSFTSGPRMRVAPLALDAINHAAGMAAYYQLERLVLPEGVDRLRLHEAIPVGEEIAVLCTYLGVSDGIARLRAVAFQPQTRKVYVEIDGLRFSMLGHLGPVLKPIIDGRQKGTRGRA
ncbi:beta-ketoacyl synthase N-terminal-like domain-containing protein [Hyalangium minutum]|uniref:Malonyl CoA-acyl carrier protein transacylase n=1 Tax=Hyalangium minutum TaxID=394096 RepID=A0A085WPB2_9BACT|nr:beta-ketoacyl synthase N-terminal-like domain-containing protein [Hyalangium minutum]KFE69525.1 Malonyl CoA-acyl carrier protein transacylase [Hyalangium minutum]